MGVQEGYLCTDGEFFDKNRKHEADEHQRKLDDAEALRETVCKIVPDDIVCMPPRDFLSSILMSDAPEWEQPARRLWKALTLYHGYATESINKEIEEIAKHFDMTGNDGGARWVRERKRLWKG